LASRKCDGRDALYETSAAPMLCVVAERPCRSRHRSRVNDDLDNTHYSVSLLLQTSGGALHKKREKEIQTLRLSEGETETERERERERERKRAYKRDKPAKESH